MLEVFEMMGKTALLIGLFYVAWVDYKTELIDTRGLLLLGTLGICLRLLSELLIETGDSVRLKWDANVIEEVLAGMLIGAILLLLAFISKESVGIGDGLLFIATGTFLDAGENFLLLLGAFMLAGVFSVGCLLLKKKGKNDSVALAPFVLTAYVMFIL